MTFATGIFARIDAALAPIYRAALRTHITIFCHSRQARRKARTADCLEQGFEIGVAMLVAAMHLIEMVMTQLVFDNAELLLTRDGGK